MERQYELHVAQKESCLVSVKTSLLRASMPAQEVCAPSGMRAPRRKVQGSPEGLLSQACGCLSQCPELEQLRREK